MPLEEESGRARKEYGKIERGRRENVRRYSSLEHLFPIYIYIISSFLLVLNSQQLFFDLIAGFCPLPSSIRSSTRRMNRAEGSPRIERRVLSCCLSWFQDDLIPLFFLSGRGEDVSRKSSRFILTAKDGDSTSPRFLDLSHLSRFFTRILSLLLLWMHDVDCSRRRHVGDERILKWIVSFRIDREGDIRALYAAKG